MVVVFAFESKLEQRVQLDACDGSGMKIVFLEVFRGEEKLKDLHFGKVFGRVKLKT